MSRHDKYEVWVAGKLFSVWVYFSQAVRSAIQNNGVVIRHQRVLYDYSCSPPRV